METETVKQSEVKEFECCPPFEPAPWEDKIIEWDDKKFIRDSVITAFYMPLNFGHIMKKLMKKIDEAGAKTPDYVCLSDHTSKWNMDVYLAVDKEIPGARNVTLSGNYFTRVYEGDYKHTKEWCDDFDKEAAARNLNIQKQYMWYTTCPKCAKKYGKNYVVIVGKVV